eukprot:GHVT01097222.1.p1 GENE.GHVT01097222.1~~GHVT01097222.1.p1  ORF type:complete len:327 (-),score=37.06 GHVT01097222.1:2677-3657(-)
MSGQTKRLQDALAVAPSSCGANLGSVVAYESPGFSSFYDRMCEMLPVEEYELGIDSTLVWAHVHEQLRTRGAVALLDLGAGTGRVSSDVIKAFVDRISRLSVGDSNARGPHSSPSIQAVGANVPGVSPVPAASVASVPLDWKLKVTCVDSSPEMLEACQHNIEQLLDSTQAGNRVSVDYRLCCMQNLLDEPEGSGKLLENGALPTLSSLTKGNLAVNEHMNSEIGAKAQDRVRRQNAEGGGKDELHDRYDVVVLAAGSFHHLVTDNDQRKFMVALSKSLADHKQSVFINILLPAGEVAGKIQTFSRLYKKLPLSHKTKFCPSPLEV